ncbi:hypothetical protein PI124_g15345 [Phytophthora idaei]|nr:hypothetical protein PI125_g10433 [Phytophthora idaei]KAG3153970.1 hypothetical protein PI126_g9842 [Phytophthora idaei]KAG3239734.1 hypothetical protein PI124_g15345 [Phytophthora idaei]
MRALVLEPINNWSDGAPTEVNDEDRYDELALDVSEMLEPIADLENLLEDLTLKGKSIEDPNSACCTDEVLHALSQLAHLETQTLTLYWKTRLHLKSFYSLVCTQYLSTSTKAGHQVSVESLSYGKASQAVNPPLT